MPSVGVAAFIFRIIVNLFFSAMLGLVCWVIGRLIFVSFFLITENTDRIVAVTTIGLGTGIGGSVGSLMLGLNPVKLALRILLIIGVALMGALVGLRIGMEVYIPVVGMPGIPELRSIVWGAMVAANALPFLLDVASAVRDRWQRRTRRRDVA